MANKPGGGSRSRDLTQGDIATHLRKLSLPMMIGILSMMAFNLIDTYFVGQLGEDQLAALSFTFPVILVLFSLIQGLGIAATALISRAIGQNDRSKAARETTDSLLLSLVISGTLVVVGLATLEPMFRLLGASERLLPLLKDYMSIWYLAIFFVVVPFVGNSAIRSTGDAVTPSAIMIFAVLVNAALDPLLIFGYGPFPALGLKGAALATAISRGLTVLVSLGILYWREKLLTFTLPSREVLFGCWKAVLRIGIPTGLSRMVTPIGNGLLTAMLARYGTTAVAGYGVGTRLEVLAMSILFALSASIGPFTGQNFGAGHMERIRTATRLSASFSLAWGAFMAALFYVAARPIAGFFSDSPEVMGHTVDFLRIAPLGFGLQGIVLVVNSNLSTVNRPLQASVLLAGEMLLVCVPLAWVLGRLYGPQGIFAGLAIAYSLGGMASYVVNQRSLRRMERSQTPASAEAPPLRQASSMAD